MTDLQQCSNSATVSTVG